MIPSRPGLGTAKTRRMYAAPSKRMVVRGNFSHHNHGPGLWTDINNINTLYEDNRIEDNDWRGIFHEISYHAVIRNNIVRRNGFYNPAGAVGAVDGAGILISSSPDVEVYCNTVEDNRSGITGQETDRVSTSSYGPHNLTGLYVHDNSVKQTDGGRGWNRGHRPERRSLPRRGEQSLGAQHLCHRYGGQMALGTERGCLAKPMAGSRAAFWEYVQIRSCAPGNVFSERVPPGRHHRPACWTTGAPERREVQQAGWP
jgi:parallel beta-helix repeat protein